MTKLFHFLGISILALQLTSCMTGSPTESTLPQTGSAGKVKMDYLEGNPGTKTQNEFKRHLTRGHYSGEDTVRVLLITEPYLKAVAHEWAENDGKKNHATSEQVEQSQDYMNQKNIKELVTDKTCFDFELNSSNEKAAEKDSWKVIVTEGRTRKEVQLNVKFALDYIQRDRGGWFQFHGVMCAPEKLNLKGGLTMLLTPLYRENKTILLKWDI